MTTLRIDDTQASVPLAVWMAFALIVISIVGAWIFEYFGYAPCPLCLQQRYAYYFGVPATVLALSLMYLNQIRLAQLTLISVAVAFVLNAALGGYHSGVEWGWWQGPTDCAGSSAMESLMDLDIGQFRKSLEETKVISCKDPAWAPFGISLAGVNFLVSLVVATLALVGTRQLSR